MAVFLTSDLHLGHNNVIKHCNRPFADVDQMNEFLIARYNAVVTQRDDVYILGDVAFCDPTPFVSRLHGRKHLILGNHDQPKLSKLSKCPFIWIKDTYELSVNGQKVWLSHYPHRSWPSSHRGAWHCYGHSHGGMPPHGKSLDVGVDCWNYAPVSFDQIAAIMATRENIDHHNYKE